MFWILATLLTLVVVAALAWPLLRGRAPSAPRRDEHDVEVYAAQLAELDADVRRGTIGEADAGIARAEIGRRLLRAMQGAADGTPGIAAGGKVLVTLGLVVAFAIPAGGVVLYAQLGAPDRPDLPLAARAVDAPAGAEFAAMVAAAEARLAQNPEDGRGWEVLAPVYLRGGETDKAVTAYRRAIELLGESPARFLGLGEALTRAAGGEVTAEARGLFERAAAADSDLIAPRIFLALDLSQEGRYAEAAPAWNAILDASPADAPWRPMAEAALRDAVARGAGDAAAAPPAEQEAMIAGMVEGLAARLAAAPEDAEGWARLVHAYRVLGEDDKAAEALAQARETFPDDTPEGRMLAAVADMPRPGEAEARP